jgi:hypothetical protein
MARNSNKKWSTRVPAVDAVPGRAVQPQFAMQKSMHR